MNIEVIEKLSEDNDSIGLNFVHSDGNISTVFFPKEETGVLYGELLKTLYYLERNVIKIPALSKV